MACCLIVLIVVRRVARGVAAVAPSSIRMMRAAVQQPRGVR